MRAPRVSIVIAAYNAAETLSETLASIEAQTFADFEIIVVDDGSSDATPLLLEGHAGTSQRLRWVRQENAGVAAARQHAISIARGELIAFNDADDLWLPDKLSRQIALLDGDTEVGFVYTNARDFFPDRDAPHTLFDQKAPARGDVLGALFRGNFVMTPTVVVKKSALQAVGGFDRTFQVNEDFDLWMRLAAHCRFDYVDDVLVRRRILESGLTRSFPMQCYQQDLRIIDDWVARRPDLFPAESTVVRKRRGLIYSRIGYHLLEERDFKGARSAYQKAIKLGERTPIVAARFAATCMPPLARFFWLAKAIMKRTGTTP